MEYSPWMKLQTIIINMDEAKALTMKIQPGKWTDKKEWFRHGSLEHLRITLEECTIGICYQNRKRPCRWVFLSKKQDQQTIQIALY